ncbi:MAG: quinate 5-dehydrogenase, partial [Actinobacteria bacterium]
MRDEAPALRSAASVKTVVSVSLGSSKRDHEVELDLFGERFHVRRIGTGGDVSRAVSLLEELDGEVDALGLGGANMSMSAAGRTWWLRNGRRFARACRETPLVDGSGLKGAVEADVVRVMAEDLGLELAGKRVLVCSAADRWGMTEGFLDAGCEVAAADRLFALRAGAPVCGREAIERNVRALGPVISLMPLTWRHPDRSDHARPEPGGMHADP